MDRLEIYVSFVLQEILYFSEDWFVFERKMCVCMCVCVCVFSFIISGFKYCYQTLIILFNIDNLFAHS